MKKLIALLLATLGLAGAVQANTGGIEWDKFPKDKMSDMASLQHGAKLFVNYCLNCHAAAYMRYNRMHDIGLTDADIKNNLLFAANSQLVAAAAELGQSLGVSPARLLDALTVCSGGSKAAMHAHRIGGIEAFANLAAPFLRKDTAAAIEAAGEKGLGLGLLGSVVESGPLGLT